MATYAFIHGAGGSAWDWHQVADELQYRGHEAVAVDLPCEDDAAGLWDYADAVTDAIAARPGLVVVAHSFGGFTAPLVCARLPVELLVLVAAMVPLPGEAAKDWWVNTGYEGAVGDREHNESEIALFYHDVPWELAAEAVTKWRVQSESPMLEPWPSNRGPTYRPGISSVATTACSRPSGRAGSSRSVWARGRTRAGGHCPFLSRPRELAARLETYRIGLEEHRLAELQGSRGAG